MHRVRKAADEYSGPDPDRIRGMFGSIAGRYDRANTIMSAGVHHLWRRAAVRWSCARQGDAVLDCATGTGDLAIAFKKAVEPLTTHSLQGGIRYTLGTAKEGITERN